MEDTPRLIARLRITIPVGLTAAVATQLLHEGTHFIAALAVGNVVNVQLFAVGTNQTGRAATLLVASSAAIVNIISAGIAFWLARHAIRPVVRLGLLIFTGFSAATGFGYLMFDPLFASPTNQLGDWKVVVQLLGGGVVVRIVLITIGAAGWIGTMFALARSSWWFLATPQDESGLVRPDQADRKVTAAAVLLAPYIAACVFFSLLVVLSHPRGAAGIMSVLLQYWFGYSLFIWATGLAGSWLRVNGVPSPVTPLPAHDRSTLIVAALAVAVALLMAPGWQV